MSLHDLDVGIRVDLHDVFVGARWARYRVLDDVVITTLSILETGDYGIRGAVQAAHFQTDLYVCVLPCLPIRISWRSTKGKRLPTGRAEGGSRGPASDPDLA